MSKTSHQNLISTNLWIYNNNDDDTKLLNWPPGLLVPTYMVLTCGWVPTTYQVCERLKQTQPSSQTVARWAGIALEKFCEKGKRERERERERGMGLLSSHEHQVQRNAVLVFSISLSFSRSFLFELSAISSSALSISFHSFRPSLSLYHTHSVIRCWGKKVAQIFPQVA